MDKDQLIASWVQDPSVRQQHMRQTPDGVAVDWPILQARAQTTLQLVLADILSHNVVRRMLANSKRTVSGSDLTATITLKSYEREIIAVTIGSAYRPLTPFMNELDFIRWNHENVGDADTSSTAAEGYYVFFNGDAGQHQLTFVPGLGDNTTAVIWFLKAFNPPYTLSMIPDDLHYIVYIGGLNIMSGRRFEAAYKDALGRFFQRISPTKIGVSQQRHDPDVEKRNRLRNSRISDTVG